MIDIYHSRRVNYKLSYYWKRNESVKIGDASKWVLENKPSGSFYAKPESEQSLIKNQIHNEFLLDRNSIVISTSDEINDLDSEDLVLYSGKTWLVVSIQRKIHIKETEFSSEEHYTSYINLRR